MTHHPEARRSAVFDETGSYRYSLLRQWDEELPRVLFCMLNPSTADETRDDPTIRRCIGFARRWGHGSLEVVNLFAFRATAPADLFRAEEPVGPENDRYIKAAAVAAEQVIVAWGNHGGYRERDYWVRKLLGEVGCLGVTKAGFPRHPLYVPGDRSPESYRTDRP